MADLNNVAGSKTTWNDMLVNGTFSSKASLLFDLDADDRADILVYKYPLGSKTFEITSQHDLCKSLDGGKFQTSLES